MGNTSTEDNIKSNQIVMPHRHCQFSAQGKTHFKYLTQPGPKSGVALSCAHRLTAAPRRLIERQMSQDRCWNLHGVARQRVLMILLLSKKT